MRDPRLRRTGLKILAVNLIASVCGILISLQLGKVYAVILILPAAVLILFAIAAMLYLVVELTLGRFLPGLRAGGGAVIFLLASVPWLSLIFMILFAWLDPATILR